MKKVFVLPPHLNKRLISTLMSTRKSDPNEPKTFSLKSSTEFASRLGDVFGKLETLEQNHEAWVSKNPTIDNFEESDTIRSTVQSDSEIFKKPVPVKNYKRKATNASNSKKRYKKWTKYSLEDIPVSSDATNSAVALGFMDELRRRKKQNSDVTDDTGKILFHKPKSKASIQTSEKSTELEDLPSLAPCKKQSEGNELIKLEHLQDD